jgi:hypothetical protein
MGVAFSGSSSLDDFWRLKLEEAQRRFSVDPNDETRAEFRRLLQLFADLMMRGQPPPPYQ